MQISRPGKKLSTRKKSMKSVKMKMLKNNVKRLRKRVTLKTKVERLLVFQIIRILETVSPIEVLWFMTKRHLKEEIMKRV